MKRCLRVFADVHRDEGGSVSLETVLIVGAIALPILIFLIKVGWPMIQQYFTQNVNTLTQDATNASQGQ